MPTSVFVVDAFADVAFQGNPAAVCLLDEAAPEAWMQRVAAEMNLSETAFVVFESDAFGLRWFTPETEVDLCGHATLASAHVLWEEQGVGEKEAISFRTKSGLLTARRNGEEIVLDFPASPVDPVASPDGLGAMLGAEPIAVGRSRFDLLVELADAATVRTLRPAIDQLGRLDARGVIVTSRSDRDGVDFVSRFFGPAVGIDEDPVTGSAHCALAPYWSERIGRSDLVGYQASRRGGTVRVRVDGDRVHLGGRAVTVLRGELLAEPF